MCSVYCTWAVLRNIPRKHQKEVVESLKEAYGSEQGLQDLSDDLNWHWRRIRTTNMMKRVNEELKRRIKVVGVSPNEESLLQRVGSS
ncbi:transposase [Methanoculleus sp. MH98A]|jgi:putative transposase|uniref:transposase n=1 Tax=Methanoculleus sp. MH98A TaxID=1495314 RepID=UPI0004A0B6B0|nr:transposase [Methanoculleus sp. MH98A]KDE55709.1 hypothetical protein EI28_05370 [Methanoculleus sp. MH98A]